MSEPRDWDLRADELAAGAIARGEPTAWFDELYAEGRAGTVSMPWDRTEPQVLLREWAEREAVEVPAAGPSWSAAGSAPTRRTSPGSGSQSTPSTWRRPPSRKPVRATPTPASTFGSPTCSRCPVSGGVPSTWSSRSSPCRRCRTRRVRRPPTRSPGWSPTVGCCWRSPSGRTGIPGRGGAAVPAGPTIHGLARPRRAARRTARGARRPALAGDVPPLTARTHTSARKKGHLGGP